MYFKKVEEIFAGRTSLNIFSKLTEVVPEIKNIIGKIFSGINKARALINIHLLPLMSNKQLHEMPTTWLLNRLHPIIEQRQQTPTSRVDVLQLMLQVMTDEAINVSMVYRT
jgi:hypothetical protein